MTDLDTAVGRLALAASLLGDVLVHIRKAAELESDLEYLAGIDIQKRELEFRQGEVRGLCQYMALHPKGARETQP